MDRELSLIPLKQTTLGFRFQTFTFLNYSGALYIHCDTFVCLQNEKTEQCDQTCGFKNKRRKRSYATRIENMIYHVASKPFLVNDLETIKTAKTDSSKKQWTISTTEQMTLRDITLLRKKQNDQMTTTESDWEFLTNPTKLTNSDNTATESNKKTARMIPIFLPRSTIKEEGNTRMLMLNNNWIVTKNITSTLTSKTSTPHNSNKRRRAESTMLKKTIISETSSSKAAGKFRFGLVWFGLICWFYGISTFVGYLTPNPFLCK